MINTITPTRAEDAIGRANDFAYENTGAMLDGSFAAGQLRERVKGVADLALDTLRGIPYPDAPGMFVPLSKLNANRFDEVATTLPGYVVLVPSVLIHPGSPALYPAIVSEDGLKNPNTIRLHVLQQSYSGELPHGAHVILSAAGQSETSGIGDHDRISASDGIEAEHFPVLLSSGVDSSIADKWASGMHLNHDWRNNPRGSVSTKFLDLLFDGEIPQATITITKEGILKGDAMILWHEGLREESSGELVTGAQNNALLVVQALGHAQLELVNPGGMRTVKSLING